MGVATTDLNPIIWTASSALLAAIALAYIMGFFSSQNQMPVEGKTIIITGATEGIGRSAAIKLAAKGANVAIVARNVDRLKSTITDIQVR